MAYVAASVEIEADPGTVWAMIGPFGSLTEWLPGFSAMELEVGGCVRRVRADDGGIFVERLISYDDPGRSCSYTITEAPVDITDHFATLRVRGLGVGTTATRVDWTAAFTAAGDVTAVVQGVFDNGLKALASRF